MVGLRKLFITMRPCVLNAGWNVIPVHSRLAFDCPQAGDKVVGKAEGASTMTDEQLAEKAPQSLRVAVHSTHRPVPTASWCKGGRRGRSAGAQEFQRRPEGPAEMEEERRDPAQFSLVPEGCARRRPAEVRNIRVPEVSVETWRGPRATCGDGGGAASLR